MAFSIPNMFMYYCPFSFIEPGPPRNVNAVSLDSYSIAVSWSPPINPRGIIAEYNVYYRSSSRVKRETAVHKNITSVSGANTTANLIGLFPFTRYSVQVAAVNVRKSDGKNLEGSKSDEISVQTAEAGTIFTLFVLLLQQSCVRSSVCSFEFRLDVIVVHFRDRNVEPSSLS